MKKSKLFSAKRIVLFLLICVLSSFMLVGLTYYFAVSTYYKNFMSANHSFRILYLLLDEDVDRESLIKNLEKNEHVEDAFLFDEYSSFGVLEEYKSDIFTGEINLIGVNPGLQKITAGADLNDEEFSMICPSDFYPEIYYAENPYNYNLNLDITKDVNKNFNLNYAGLKNVSIKLSGVFDRSYDYTDPNVCYVTHDTLRKLNDMVYEANEDDIKDIFVLIDDLQNIELLYKYSGVQEVMVVTTIRGEILTNILYTIGLFTFVFIIFIIMVCYLFNSRHILNNYKNIGIYRIVGYSKKRIKKGYYIETLIISFLSFSASIIFSNFVLSKFINYFLYDNPQLSMMNMKLSLIVILMSLVIILFPSISSTYISLKKIDDMDICEIINE